jgi:hypothetical protein
METVPQFPHFPDEALIQLLLPTPFKKKLQGAFLNGVPADVLFCQGLFQALHK